MPDPRGSIRYPTQLPLMMISRRENTLRSERSLRVKGSLKVKRKYPVLQPL
jgi:hypothetical protein